MINDLLMLLYCYVVPDVDKINISEFLKNLLCQAECVISVQFLLKLQQLPSHDLSNSNVILGTLWHNGAQNVDNNNISKFFKKISYSSERTIRTQFSTKLFNLMSHDLSHEFLLEHFRMMLGNRLRKVAFSHILLKFCFKSQLCSLDPIWARNYENLCPRQLCLMIHQLKILKCCMMGYHS